MSEAQMFKQMELGNLISEDVLPKVAKQYAKVARENGALESATKKLNSENQRFLNALTKMKLELGEGGFKDGMAYMFRGLAETINSIDWKGLGGIIGGTLKGFTEAIRVLTLPLQAVVHLFSMMNTQVAQFVGAGIAIALLANKVVLLARGLQLLGVSAAMLSKSPVGLAIAGTVLLGSVAYGVHQRSAASSMANNVAQGHASNQQSVKVMVEPNERGFTNLIRTEVRQDAKSWSSALADAGNA